MANGNPFGIVPVDVAGVFGQVQQFKNNALNLQLGQQGLELNELKINAAKADIARQKEAREAREAAIGAKPNAIDQAFIIDPEEGRAIQDFVLNKNKEERTTVALAGRKIAGLLAGVLSDTSIPEGAPIPQEVIDEALALGIKLEDIPLTKDSEQIKRSIFQTKQFATLLENANRGAKMFVKFTDKGEQETTSAIPGSKEARALEAEGFVEAGKPRVDLPGSGISPQGLTKPQIGAQKIKLEEALVQTVDVLKLSQRTIELLEAPDAEARVGVVAAATRTIDSIFAQFRGLGVLIGDDEVTPDVVKDFEGRKTREGKPLFGSFAAESVRIKTNLIRLTSILAVLNNDGSRPSDFDQKRADLMASITSGSPAQMRAALEEIEEQAIGRFKTRFDAEQIRLFPDNPEKRKVFNAESTFGDFGVVLQGDTLPLVASQAEFDALPSGAKYRETPNGRIFEKP